MRQAKFKVAIVGATGYGGSELVRLLAAHPNATITTVTSSRRAGTPLREECPWLATDLELTEFVPEQIVADFTFLCQENGFAMQNASKLIQRTRVIDLSADFRLQDIASYERIYRRTHSSPDLTSIAVYGLPELVSRSAIAKANLVANPGCYPTASLLALMPLVNADAVAGIPVIDAKSGVSGAGRSRQETEYLYAEIHGAFKAYAAVGHRHTAEIEQLSGKIVRFTPHLVPMARGIHATAHIPLAEGWTESRVRDLYRETYTEEPFVEVQDALPSTKEVVGSNRCVISVSVDERCRYAVVCSVIDNLVKGMAGQAIQNMNLMAGLPEVTGLPTFGVWP